MRTFSLCSVLLLQTPNSRVGVLGFRLCVRVFRVLGLTLMSTYTLCLAQNNCRFSVDGVMCLPSVNYPAPCTRRVDPDSSPPPPPRTPSPPPPPPLWPTSVVPFGKHFNKSDRHMIGDHRRCLCLHSIVCIGAGLPRLLSARSPLQLWGRGLFESASQTCLLLIQIWPQGLGPPKALQDV